MKQIVAWVNKNDEKELRQYSNLNVYFASSISDFSSHLNSNTIALLSITKAGRYWKQIDKIIEKHKKIIFYFTEKIDKSMTYGELYIQERDNVYHPMSPIAVLVKSFNL